MLYSKSNSGFYSKEIHGNEIPADAIEITDDEYKILLNGACSGKAINIGTDGRPELVEITPSDDYIKSSLSSAVQMYLDDAAQAKGYDNIASAVTYADEPEIKEFQKDGKSFRKWRSKVWAYYIDVTEQYDSGQFAELPTQEEMLAAIGNIVRS